MAPSGEPRVPLSGVASPRPSVRPHLASVMFWIAFALRSGGIRLETDVAASDTEAVVKAYGVGLFSAALAVLLVGAIWFGTQSSDESGLLWGDTVYSSEQEFKGYLKSKGLSYETWLARNPGAAPWEPGELTVGAITVRASTKVVQSLAWLLATAGALLLLRSQRPDIAGFAKGSVALFSVVLAGLLIVATWSTQPKREPGLEWGGTTYASKQEFNGYLRSKGLSYKSWVARNPGAAPWEPTPVRAPAKAPGATKVRDAESAADGWTGQPLLLLLLPAIGLIVAAGCALLLLRGRRPQAIRIAGESVAFGNPGSINPGSIRIGKSSVGMPAAQASMRFLGVAASGATDRLRVSVPRSGERVIRVSRGSAGLLIRAARATGRWFGQLMRERDISAGDVAVGLLTVVGAVMVGLIVVFLASV
ncbi:MAG: hypothetical protein ABIR95_03320, partial [Gaiellaceae bacterium]